ncbi:uncharacterized protein TNCV_240101 [Trichonephila clavipes]|nr:uncharacterized protein TNCV_240101 [Trichonephila clavipes]
MVGQRKRPKQNASSFSVFLCRRICRTGRDDKALLKLPPRSLDMTPLFLWDFIKDEVFVPTLPPDLMELRPRIRYEFAAVKSDMLLRVWTEMDYRLNICRVPKGPILNL